MELHEHDQVSKGELLNQKRKKYWVDKKSNSNSFFLDAKNLSFTNFNLDWRWSNRKETSNTVVDVAELIQGNFLEVRGKFEITKLPPGTAYEVAFVILLKEDAFGWEVPVNVRLVLPDGNKQERNENFMNKPIKEWIKISVGEFVASPKRIGEIEFSIYEHRQRHRKSGLVIRGIAIRPICQMDRVDRKSKSNCLFLDAKNLSIAFVEDSCYWRWLKIEETRSNVVVDAPELLGIDWLEVRGKFEITKLSPGTTYEVAFVILLKENASGWEVPVNVGLVLPDGNIQERKENFNEKPREEWIEIPVGEFVTSPKRTGEIEFSIYEHDTENWKSGLVIKGIAIRPIYQMDWIDRKFNSNCLFLDAKNLSIDGVEFEHCWRWSKIKETETSNVVVDAPELLGIDWLDVRGKFEITKLSPGTIYEVAFVILLKENASGWEVPVNVGLVLPEYKQERKENFKEKPRGEWIEIRVSEFIASPKRAGEVGFSIYEHGGHWKRGLLIKRVVIRPK